MGDGAYPTYGGAKGAGGVGTFGPRELHSYELETTGPLITFTFTFTFLGGAPRHRSELFLFGIKKLREQEGSPNRQAMLHSVGSVHI